MTTDTNQESVDIQQLAIWTTVSAVSAAVINAILFIVLSGQFEGVEAMGEPFSLMPVIFSSIIFIAIGGIFLGILARFVSRSITIWRWIAIVYLVLSFAQPFMFLQGDDVTLTPRIILVTMHIIAGGITIYLLTTRTQKPS